MTEKEPKTLKIVDVNVWIQDSPEYPIEGMEGATKSRGHFENKKAILVEGLVAQLKQRLGNCTDERAKYCKRLDHQVIREVLASLDRGAEETKK